MKRETHDANEAGRATAERRDTIRARLDKLRGSRQRSIVGMPEVVGLAVAGFLFLAAVFSYVYFLAPERARLRTAQEDRRLLQKELLAATEGRKQSESTQASVEEIVKSLDDFENVHLASRNESATGLIEDLNGLIRRNSLRITTGVSFTQFDVAAPDASGQPRVVSGGGSVKALQNVFPGFGVNLTVEGTYQNQRRFIREVESDKRFIVINAVELEGVTDTRAPSVDSATAAASPAGAGRGTTLVSLRLDLAAYFRRPNVTSIDTTGDGGAPR